MTDRESTADEGRRAVPDSESRAGETRGSNPEGGSGVYVESDVILTTVRLVVPFSLTYGLFLVFHGADSAGGSFQGGTIVAATVLLVAFTFGIEVTREWLANRTVVGLVAGGALGFAVVGLAPLAFGRNFLEHAFLTELGVETKYGLEAAEIAGVAPVVAGVIAGLFFVIAAGSLDGQSGASTDEKEATDSD